MPISIEEFKQAFAGRGEEDRGLKRRDQQFARALKRLEGAIQAAAAADASVDGFQVAKDTLVSRYKEARGKSARTAADMAAELDEIILQAEVVIERVEKRLPKENKGGEAASSSEPSTPPGADGRAHAGAEQERSRSPTDDGTGNDVDLGIAVSVKGRGGTQSLPGAMVRIIDATGKQFAGFTGQDGSYHERVAAGLCAYEVSHSEHGNVKDTHVLSGPATELAVTLPSKSKSSAAAEQVEFWIRIFDDGSGDPVANARVTVGRTSRATDADGWAGFDLAPGDYPYSVQASGYHMKKGKLDVPRSNEPVKQFITLVPTAGKSADIFVRVLDARTHAPIANAKVRLSDEMEFTDNHGVARFLSVPFGPQWILALAEGHKEAEIPPFNHEGEFATSFLEILLEPEPAAKPKPDPETAGSDTDQKSPEEAPGDESLLTISVCCFDSRNGSPIDGATVRVGDEFKVARVYAEFSLPPGPHTLEGCAAGFLPATLSIGLPDPVNDSWAIELHPDPALNTPGSDALVIVVWDPGTAQAIVGAKVSVGDHFGITDELGNASFWVLPGPHDYQVSADGYEPKSGTVKPDERDYYSVELKRRAAVEETADSVGERSADRTDVVYLTVNVTDAATGTAINEAEVTVADESRTTDATGNAWFTPPSGTHPYRVSAALYAEAAGTITLPDDGDYLRIELQPKPAGEAAPGGAGTPRPEELRELGVQVRKGDGQPIVGATVTIADQSLETDPDGWTRFTLLPGPYTYRASANGFEPRSGKLEVPDEPYSARCISLDPDFPEGEGVVTVRVRHAVSREPIEIATVRFGSETALTNKVGEARFLAVKFGEHPWEIDCDHNFEKPKGSLAVRQPQETLEIDLKPVSPDQGTGMPESVLPGGGCREEPPPEPPDAPAPLKDRTLCTRMVLSPYFENFRDGIVEWLELYMDKTLAADLVAASNARELHAQLVPDPEQYAPSRPPLFAHLKGGAERYEAVEFRSREKRPRREPGSAVFLTVYVEDGSTKSETIENATVDVDGAVDVTPLEGCVYFSVGPGRRPFTASADGFETLKGTFDVEDTEEWDETIRLKPVREGKEAATSKEKGK